MTRPTRERRRVPRLDLTTRPDWLDATLPLAATVQVIDMSQSGVLLSSSQTLERGQRARFRTRIGPEPLSVVVECRRVAPAGRHDEVVQIGAVFVDLDDESRRKIDAFLRTDES